MKTLGRALLTVVLHGSLGAVSDRVREQGTTMRNPHWQSMPYSGRPRLSLGPSERRSGVCEMINGVAGSTAAKSSCLIRYRAIQVPR